MVVERCILLLAGGAELDAVVALEEALDLFLECQVQLNFFVELSFVPGELFVHLLDALDQLLP